jgi:hypothetical protein
METGQTLACINQRAVATESIAPAPQMTLKTGHLWGHLVFARMAVMAADLRFPPGQL